MNRVAGQSGCQCELLIQENQRLTRALNEALYNMERERQRIIARLPWGIRPQSNSWQDLADAVSQLNRISEEHTIKRS